MNDMKSLKNVGLPLFTLLLISLMLWQGDTPMVTDNLPHREPAAHQTVQPLTPSPPHAASCLEQSVVISQGPIENLADGKQRRVLVVKRESAPYLILLQGLGTTNPNSHVFEKKSTLFQTAHELVVKLKTSQELSEEQQRQALEPILKAHHAVWKEKLHDAIWSLELLDYDGKNPMALLQLQESLAKHPEVSGLQGNGLVFGL